eukprot:gene1920-biopygen14743
MSNAKIFSGNNLYTWRNAWVHILLDLKSDKDCIAIAYDCQQPAPLAGEPNNSDCYPADDITYPVVAGADPAVPVRGVPNWISTWKNNKAFKMILDRVSDSIQQAILAHTDMATKAFRFLDSLYSEQAGCRELTSVTNLYALNMSAHESLQTYLSRSADLYAQLPQIQGTSNTSIPTFLNLIVKGLNSRPEYDGYINQFNPSEVTTFAILQAKITNWCLVKNVDPAPYPEEAEMAAAAYRPVDSDAADNGSKSPPKERSGDDKDSGKKKSPPRWRSDPARCNASDVAVAVACRLRRRNPEGIASSDTDPDTELPATQDGSASIRERPSVSVGTLRPLVASLAGLAASSDNFLEETDSDNDMEGIPDLVTPEVYSQLMAERAKEFKPLSEDQQVGDPPDIPTISPATQQRHLLRIISPTPDLPDHLNNLSLQQARAEMELLSDQIRTNYEDMALSPIDFTFINILSPPSLATKSSDEFLAQVCHQLALDGFPTISGT